MTLKEFFDTVKDMMYDEIHEYDVQHDYSRSPDRQHYLICPFPSPKEWRETLEFNAFDPFSDEPVDDFTPEEEKALLDDFYAFGMAEWELVYKWRKEFIDSHDDCYPDEWGWEDEE